jgi:hypothetical protein
MGTATASRPASGLAVVDDALLGVLLIAMSSQVNLGDIGQDTTAQGYVTKQLKVALPDLALLLNIVWFAARTTMLRAWKRLWWPPLPAWALLFSLGLALVHAPSVWSKVAESLAESEANGLRAQAKAALGTKGVAQAVKEGVAETIQFALYFGVAPLILANLLVDRRAASVAGDEHGAIDRREFALRIFAGGVVLMLGLALLQLATGSARVPESPQALFGSPNAFGAWFAIVLPLVFSWSQRDAAPAILRRLALPVAAIGLVVVMSLWAHLALVVGLALAAFLARGTRRVRLGVLALLVAVAVGMLWSQSPRDARRQPFVQLGSGKEKVKKSLIEWYATTGFARPRQNAFAGGVGPGNYQIKIGEYYSSLPNEEKMPPDSNNVYLVQAVSIGLLGLSALLWTLGHFAQQANAARKYLQAHARDAWLPLGVLGSLASWAIVNLFHASIVRGTGLVLALLFALAAVALAGENNNRTNDDARASV